MCLAGDRRLRAEKTRGAAVPWWDSGAPWAHASGPSWDRALEARRPDLVEIDRSRRRGLVRHPVVGAALFLALPDDGEAGHDGCDGYETDT